MAATAESDKAPAVHEERTMVPGMDEAESKKAAEIIQRTYRGHRTRRQLNGFGLDASTRWYEAVKDAQYHQLTTPAPPRAQSGLDSISPPQGETPASPPSLAKKNWQRARKIAQRAGSDDRSPPLSEISESSEPEADTSGMTVEQREARDKRRREATERRRKQAKTMDLSYFLEMVDQKHRYGSSLRKYHAYWMTQGTSQNFFYWLDQGDGKDVSLPECSRKRLDTEQVRYLSRDERQNYLVKIDDQGLLRWAKNGEKVWTKDELYKDSVKGIVPTSDHTPKFKYNVAPEQDSSEDSESEEDPTAADEGEHYVNEDFHRARGLAKIKHVTAGALFNHMIRTSLKKGHKWIFVCDTSFRLYIGYKQSGAFQHSSFLHGSRITSAGLIKVKHGQLRSLSPLSGHYRPKAENFRIFVHGLRDEGVDMSRVSISKSYAVLVGIESYQRSTKKLKEAGESVTHERDKLFNPDKVKAAEEAKRDKSKSAEKERQYLAQQRLEEEERRRADRGFSRRVSGALGKLRGKEEAGSSQHAGEGKRAPGTGPEDSVPPPDAELLLR